MTSPLGKYLWQELSKSLQALIFFFLIPLFSKFGTESYPPCRNRGLILWEEICYDEYCLKILKNGDFIGTGTVSDTQGGGWTILVLGWPLQCKMERVIWQGSKSVERLLCCGVIWSEVWKRWFCCSCFFFKKTNLWW